MNRFTYYIPFLIFVVIAWIYYDLRMKKKNRLLKEKREKFLSETEDLTEEQRNNLSAGLPWKGMDAETLRDLFGEPQRKRILDGTLTRIIWSYGSIFVYVENDAVTEWKKR